MPPTLSPDTSQALLAAFLQASAQRDPQGQLTPEARAQLEALAHLAGDEKAQQELLQEAQTTRLALPSFGPRESHRPASPAADDDEDGRGLADYYADLLNLFYERGKTQGLLDLVAEDLAETSWQVSYDREQGQFVAAPQKVQLSLVVRLSEEWTPYLGKRGEKKGQQIGWQKGGRVSYGLRKPGSSRERFAGKAVDVAGLKGKLAGHRQATGELSKAQLGNVKRAFAALKRHHGDLTMHRLEELHGELEAILNQTHPEGAMFGLRQRKLAELSHMLDMAEGQGLRGEAVGEVASPTTDVQEQPADLPPAATSPEGTKMTSKDGTVWEKAPKGGMTSPVNGKFYKGGQWVPVHGLSEEKKPGGNQKQGQAPSKPKEDEEGKGGSKRGPLSPEMIEEDRRRREDKRLWDEVNAGVIGRIKWLGETPNSHAMKNSVIDINKWKEFAGEIGEPKLKALADTLKAAYEERVDREVAADLAAGHKIPDDAAEWEKNEPVRQAEQTAQMIAGSKKHLKDLPSSYLAKHYLSYNLDGVKSVQDLHALDQKLQAIVAGQPTPQPPAAAPAPAAQEMPASEDAEAAKTRRAQEYIKKAAHAYNLYGQLGMPEEAHKAILARHLQAISTKDLTQEEFDQLVADGTLEPRTYLEDQSYEPGSPHSLRHKGREVSGARLSGKAAMALRKALAQAPAAQETPPVSDKGAGGAAVSDKGAGTAGASHPLAGLPRQEQVKKLGQMFRHLEDQDPSADPLGVRRTGPPSGLDMPAFQKDLLSDLSRHMKKTSGGAQMHVIYPKLAEKYGLSKHDFLRAVNTLHDQGKVKLSGWPRMLDEVPDPELFSFVQSKGMYYLQPPFNDTETLDRHILPD